MNCKNLIIRGIVESTRPRSTNPRTEGTTRTDIVPWNPHKAGGCSCQTYLSNNFMRTEKLNVKKDWVDSPSKTIPSYKPLLYPLSVVFSLALLTLVVPTSLNFNSELPHACGFASLTDVYKRQVMYCHVYKPFIINHVTQVTELINSDSIQITLNSILLHNYNSPLQANKSIPNH